MESYNQINQMDDDSDEIRNEISDSDEIRNEIPEDMSPELFDHIVTSDPVLELLFDILLMVKYWVNDDEQCTKAVRAVLAAAEELDKVQFGVDVTKAAGASVGIGSGIVGILGFGLLFNPFTVVGGVALLGISGGTGGIGAIAEISAKAHNWRIGKKSRINVRREVHYLAKMDYEQIGNIAKEFGNIVETIAKQLKINNEIVMIQLLTFSSYMFSSNEIFQEAFADDHVELPMIRPSGSLFKRAKMALSMQSLSEMKSHCRRLYRMFTTAFSIAAPIFTGTGGAIKLSTSAAYSAVDAASAIRVATNTADVAADVAGTFAGTFANLGKIAGLGCVFSVLNIGLGSHTIYDAVKNIKSNEKDCRSVSSQGRIMRANASLITLGTQLRASIPGNAL